MVEIVYNLRLNKIGINISRNAFASLGDSLLRPTMAGTTISELKTSLFFSLIKLLKNKSMKKISIKIVFVLIQNLEATLSYKLSLLMSL